MAKQSGNEYLKALGEINASGLNTEEKYKKVMRLFKRFCAEACEDSPIAFANSKARIEYLADRHKIPYKIISAIRLFQREYHADEAGRQDAEKLKADMMAVMSLIINLTGGVPSQELRKAMQGVTLRTPQRNTAWRTIDKIRVCVVGMDNIYIYGRSDNRANEEVLKIRYNVAGVNEEFADLEKMVYHGAMLNLLDVSMGADGSLVPQMIILNPDYLLDCSAVAECYTSYGVSEYTHLYSRLCREGMSLPMMLGNIANFYHDELLFGQGHDGSQQDFYKTTNDAFHTMPIELSANPDLQNQEKSKEFFNMAQAQFNNIKTVVENVFPQMGIDKRFAELEPSFVCEDIGMQGRMDFLQVMPGNNIIIEMKSGKAGFPESNPTLIAINHQAQTTLYYYILQRTLRVPFNQIKAYVFYSKYEPSMRANLRMTNFTLRGVKQILNLRNRIVAMEYRLATAKNSAAVRAIVDNIAPNTLIADFDGRGGQSKLVREWILPKIMEFRGQIQKADDMERAYFYSMLQFIAMEQMHAKAGGAMPKGSRGFADNWLSTEEEKTEQGEIITKMRMTESGFERGEPTATFAIPSEYAEEKATSFRKGDIVVLYEKMKGADNITNKRNFRAAIEEIGEGKVTLRFRQIQRADGPISMQSDKLYAIEPDYMDATFNGQYGAMFSFLKADKKRRDMMLGRTMPKGEERELRTKIEDEDLSRIVRKAKGTDSYFLLVGPPGTGKTSRALKAMVKEFYAEEGDILLASYTNRAVDEICEAIESIEPKIEYMRIGHRLTTDEKFHKNLIDTKVKECNNRAEVAGMIRRHRVVVSTVSALNGKAALFAMKHFKVAIIDESSQILEPQMMGLLCARDAVGRHAVDKFVMIGDHRQLPAVVAQSEGLSVVPQTDSILYGIGLKDRRNSLFERLYRLNAEQGNTTAYDTLTRQGRMHPEVAEFANKNFYGGMLRPVPVAHQTEELEYRVYDAENELERRIATKRVDFFNAEKNKGENEKCSPDEARIVAEIVETIKRLYEKNGMDMTEKSIGVITLFRAQIAMIKKEMEKRGIDTKMVMTDTVERYQGSQRDIIIYSFCLNERYQIDFARNEMEADGQIVDRKLNVALTRARKQMFLVGCKEVMQGSDMLRRVMEGM